MSGTGRTWAGPSIIWPWQLAACMKWLLHWLSCLNSIFQWSIFILMYVFNCKYRVSHGKVNKVIWLCWGYSFWFFLICWVLWVHEKGTFMPNSSVFIFLMLRGLYSMICKNWKKKFAKNSLNVTSVKLLSKIFFDNFVCFLMLSCFQQGAHYESTYNVSYKGEVGTQYLGFREKNNFYCPVSDKGSENCH